MPVQLSPMRPWLQQRYYDSSGARFVKGLELKQRGVSLALSPEIPGMYSTSPLSIVTPQCSHVASLVGERPVYLNGVSGIMSCRTPYHQMTIGREWLYASATLLSELSSFCRR